MNMATASCLMFEMHDTWRARDLAFASACRIIPARIAMMAITTKSSMSVNAPCRRPILFLEFIGTGLRADYQLLLRGGTTQGSIASFLGQDGAPPGWVRIVYA